MLSGVILKGIGGLYFVDTDNGVYACKPRGIFRYRNQKPMIGDFVKIDVVSESDKEAVIIDVENRTSALYRPAVANVDQVLITFSVASPNPNFILIDKIILLTEKEKLEPVIVFNKSELGISDEVAKRIEIYKNIGYRVIITSAKTNEGIEELREVMSDRISVFAGPSGVGKSSLSNAILPGIELKTGEISEKIKRGKHTTRHSELIKLDFGGFLVDTPGFTNLDLHNFDVHEISEYFIEFESLEHGCKFNDCAHISEPGCEVKEALKNGEIFKERYDSYIYIRNEILSRKERY